MEKADLFCLRNRVGERVICVAPQHGFPAAEIQLAKSTPPGISHRRNHLIPGHIAPAGVGNMTATAGKITSVCQCNAVDERFEVLQDDKTPGEWDVKSNPVPERTLKSVEISSRLELIQAVWCMCLRHRYVRNLIGVPNIHTSYLYVLIFAPD
jgi:hypothetical protein